MSASLVPPNRMPFTLRSIISFFLESVMWKAVDAVAQAMAVGVPAVEQVVGIPHPILPTPVPPWLNVFNNKPFL